MANNGLDTFSMHSQDDAQGPTIATINTANADDAQALDLDMRALDPETAARRSLDQMIVNPDVPLVADEAAEYRIIGTETVPLTDTKIVKFAQYRHRIPVYGSLVSVELDNDNSLLSISSARGNPDVDPVAGVSPAQAQATIAEDAGGNTLPLAEPPRLYFYFDQTAQPAAWRLVYIAKHVRRGELVEGVPDLVDYVVDAHSGEIVARLPRVKSATWQSAEVKATDGLGNVRRIRVQRDESGNRHRLRDDCRNLETSDFGGRDLQVHFGALPGDPVENPPEWEGGAISAHANAQEVADYLVTVLRRNGLDNQGGPYFSTVNCTNSDQPSANPGEWRNAAWVGTQMVYGQRLVNGQFRSYALPVDVVGHELVHGLTDHTADLVYEFESGALNESYSDILGVVISNRNTPDIGAWNWELGEDLEGTGVPLRDLSDPTAFGQPDHMDDFKVLPATKDHGGVHTNSGIHNKAAFNLITSKDAQGEFLFEPEQCAQLFFLALTQRLSRTSGFSDSRRGVDLAAKSLFSSDPSDFRAAKLAAIAAAFDKVGIDA